MTIQRLPILASTDVEDASSTLTEGSEYARNIMYDKYPDGRVYATQRPGITINNTPEFTGREKRGRGAYNWEKYDRTYQVINDTVYLDYSGSIGTISAGLSRVYFVECDDALALLDPENNEGWIIDNANGLTQITDSNFPPNQTPARELAGGGVWLDGNLYVLDTLGVIWNSNDNDPTTFDALGFIEAGRQEDGGVYLAQHGPGLAVVGTRTIEFFYNAGNATGSPLARRQDTMIHLGALNENAVTVQGNKVYFVGSEGTGTLGVYLLDNYQLAKLSTKSIDDFIAEARHTKQLSFFVSSMLIRGHQVCFISGVQSVASPGGGGEYFSADYIEDQGSYVVIEGTDLYDTQFTLVYDQTIGTWSTWDSSILENGGFPVLVGTSKLRSRNTVASVLFLNGEIAEVTADYAPVDQTIIYTYFDTDDYIENQSDYITDQGEDTYTAIPMSVRIGEWDGGTMTNKYCHRLEVVGTTLAEAAGEQDIQVSWSDDHFRTFSTPRNLDTEFRRKLSRLGNFKRRSFQLDYEGLDPLRIEGIEIDVRASRYAR